MQHTGNSGPTFSVIMPCYNSQAYVRGALESVLNQTWPHWELVAVNDGSKDDTLNILKEYAAKDSRVRVYSKDNGGYVSAVNHGLDFVCGDYFLMMGSDDALATDLFENLAKAMDGKMPDCVAFRTEIIQDGVNLGVESITDFSGDISGFDTDLAKFAGEYPAESEIFFTRDTSKCYRRTLLGDLRYFGRYGFDADGIFSMLLCHNASSFRVVPVTGYYWTLRGDSLSGRKSFYEQDCDRVVNWTRFYRILLDRNKSLAETEKQYLHYFFGLIRTVARENTGIQDGILQDAVSAVREVARKEGYDLDLSKKDRLLLRHPLLWSRFSRFLG